MSRTLVFLAALVGMTGIVGCLSSKTETKTEAPKGRHWDRGRQKLTNAAGMQFELGASILEEKAGSELNEHYDNLVRKATGLSPTTPTAHAPTAPVPAAPAPSAPSRTPTATPTPIEESREVTEAKLGAVRREIRYTEDSIRAFGFCLEDAIGRVDPKAVGHYQGEIKRFRLGLAELAAKEKRLMETLGIAPEPPKPAPQAQAQPSVTPALAPAVVVPRAWRSSALRRGFVEIRLEK